jgi:hypothetical protein
MRQNGHKCVIPSLGAGGEFTLSEYSIRIPFQVQWSGDENLVHAEVMTIGSC